MSLFSHLLAFVLGGIFFLGGSVTLLIWLLAKKTKKNERYLRAKVPQIRLEDPSEQQNAQVRRPDKVSSASTISSSNVSSNVPSSASSGSSIREPENVPSSSRQKKKAIKKQKKEEKELEKQQRQKEKKDREEEKKREKEMKKQKQQQPQNVHAATSAATAAVMATAISSRRGSTVPSSASSSSASLSFSEQQLMNASRANENEAHALPSLAVSAPDSGLPSTTSFSSSSNTSTSTPSFTTASSFENINSHHSFNESDSASTITTEEPSSSDLTSATTTPVSSTEQLLPPSNLRSHSIPKRAATIAGAPMGLAKALDKARKKSLAHYSDSMPAPFFPGRGSTSAFATPEGEDGAAEQQQQQPPNNPFFQDKIIAKSGWLHLKRAKFFYKRWCVLVDDQIAYLSSPKSKTIRGLIKLEGCRTIALKERTFKIAHPEKQRIFTRKIKKGQDEDDGEDSSDEEELVEPSFFSPASSSPSALPQQDGRKNSESIKKEEKKRMKKEQKDEEKERKRAEKEKKKSATFSKKTGRASGEVFVTPKRNSSDSIAKEKDKGGLPSSYSNDDIASIDINNNNNKSRSKSYRITMKASSDADMLDWLSAIRTAISKAEEKAAVSVVSTASEGRESGELSGSEGGSASSASSSSSSSAYHEGWLEMLNAGQDKGLSCFSTWWFIVDSKSLRYFKNKSETSAKDCLGLIRLRGCKVKKRKKNKEKAAVDPFRTLTFKIFNKSGASLYSTTRPDGLPFNATVFRTQTDKCILRAGSEETLAKWMKAIEKGIKLASKTSGLAQMAMSLSATPPLPNNALPSPRRRPSQDLSTDSFTLNSDEASFSSITSDASFSSTSTIQPSAASSASSSPTSSPSSSYILQKDPTQKHQQPQQESPKQQHKQKEDEKTAKTNSLNEHQTDSIPTTTVSAFTSSTPAPQTTTASPAATSTSLAPPSSSAASSSNPTSPNFPSASSSSPSSSSAASGNQENAFHSFAVENRNRLMQSEWLQCEWFNIILERDFADMQQSTVFREGLARRLQRKFDAKKKRPAYLGPIKISNIDVGSSFLRVQKIKLLRGCLENEVIGEALLDYNGGFSVSVSTEVYINWPRDRFATIPMKITLTISRISGKLHIYGPPKLMERFRASFAEMPETDIGVRVEIGEKYRQVNWLPKVDKYLVTTLKKFVRDRLVYPNRMTFFLPFPGRKFSLKTENVTKPKKPKPPASAAADASSSSAAPSTSTAGSSSSSAPSSSATPARTLSSVDPDLESKKLYLMSFFDAINTGQLKNLSVLFAPNVKLMGLSSRSIPDKTKQEQGFKALLNSIKHLHQVFEGLSFSIQMVEHIPKQNGQLWCRWKLRGLWRYSFMGLAPSQEQVEFGGMSFFTFAMQPSQQPQPDRAEAGNEDEAAHLRVTVYEEEWNFVDVMHHHHHHQTHGRGGGGGAEDASSPQTS